MGNPEKLMNQIFDLKFTSKSLQRQARKCEKEEKEQKLKVKKAIEKGNMDGARIYAENAIRKRTEHMNYLRIHEYQGAELMGKYGINVPRGAAAGSVQEVKDVLKNVFPSEKEMQMRGLPSGSHVDRFSRNTHTLFGRKLEEELDGWLREAGLTKSPDVRAVIAPHAGYSYSGRCAAYAFGKIDPINIYALYDTKGRQVPPELVEKIGKVFETILEETGKLREEANEDISIAKAIAIVMERNPHLKQEGIAHDVLQGYL